LLKRPLGPKLLTLNFDPILGVMLLLDDDELVKLSQGGRYDAFSELLRRNYHPAFKLPVSILRERHEAEDEVQNAFWKAYQHIGQFQQDSKFSTWLTRIVVNQCLMRLRQTRRARFLYIDDIRIGDEVATLELRDWRSGPEQLLGREQVASLLHREIRKIPPLLRSVFLLRDVERLPMPDVAQQLG